MIFQSILALIFLVLSACSSHIKKTEVNDNLVRIKLNRISSDRWQVEYKLPRSVEGVVFHRQVNQFRKNYWKIKTPGLKFKMIDNQECIVSENKSFNYFKVEFDSYFDHTPKDYEFFRRFSDGGRLIYTGHLYLHPVKIRYKNLYSVDEEVQWKQSLQVSIQPKQEIRWEDKSLRGTYLFLGKTEPIDSNQVKAYIDPKIPDWIKNQLDSFFPKLIDYYSLKTGHDLSFKPVLYFDYSKITRPGTSYSGGTLPELVQLSIEGRGWQRKNNDNIETITKFFAHEIAHFWNGGMFNNSDSRAAWLHEGGADAFAFKALSDLGLISKLRLKQNFESSYNFCRTYLNSTPLNMSSKYRRYKNYYHCGAFIWFALDRALKNQNSDMFVFWEKLLARASAKKGKYNSEDFHFILKNDFKQKRLSELIFDLEWEDRGRSKYLLEQMAENVGIKLLPVFENLPPEFTNTFYQNLISNLMRKDCRGRVDVYGHGSVFKVRGNEICSTLKKKEYTFVGAQGKSFRKGGIKLMRKIESICQEKECLTLNYNDGRESVNLKCNIDEIDHPQWYSFSNI